MYISIWNRKLFKNWVYYDNGENYHAVIQITLILFNINK